MAKRKALILIVSLSILCTFCTRSPPEIAYTTMQLILFEKESEIVPRILFFALVNDQDGIEDIAELQLYNDFEGLFWSLKPETWVNYEEGGRRWLGSRNLGLPIGEKFPSGGYRAALIDRGGERSEKLIGFSGDAATRHPFPKFQVTGGNFRAETEYPDNNLFMYSQNGTLRGNIKLPNKTGSLASLNLPADIFFLELWATDKEYSVQAVTKRIEIKTVTPPAEQ